MRYGGQLGPVDRLKVLVLFLGSAIRGPDNQTAQNRERQADSHQPRSAATDFHGPSIRQGVEVEGCSGQACNQILTACQYTSSNLRAKHLVESLSNNSDHHVRIERLLTK